MKGKKTTKKTRHMIIKSLMTREIQGGDKIRNDENNLVGKS